MQIVGGVPYKESKATLDGGRTCGRVQVNGRYMGANLCVQWQANPFEYTYQCIHFQLVNIAELGTVHCVYCNAMCRRPGHSLLVRQQEFCPVAPRPVWPGPSSQAPKAQAAWCTVQPCGTGCQGRSWGPPAAAHLASSWVVAQPTGKVDLAKAP
jgi:hypothetical protein